MLTYELKKSPGVPLYEALYRCLRQDILSGKLSPGTKLPSKRALAENLKVSKITVEGAYNQLLAEGYLSSREKVGYFVERTEHTAAPAAIPAPPLERSEPPMLDLTANGPAGFPFTVWSRLQREVMLDRGETLLRPLHSQGCPELRRAIAAHLADFRGMSVSPENIIVGAGADFLYNLLLQLLGREKTYAVEDPGYDKIRKIYTSGGALCMAAPMDEQGVMPQALGDAQVLHISPSHHFPTGIVTSMARRQALLSWAESVDGYIVEDDYDSEFRFHAHPMPALKALDRQGRVIYMNSFSKSLAPSIRISYMILPDGLLARFGRELGFYSCTVSSFEQYTLAQFLSQGYFEKHINRMRKYYRSRRDRVIRALETCPWAERMSILEKDAGLHFLVKVQTVLDDDALTALWAQCGIRVRALSSYYCGEVPPEDRGCLVVNYSGLDENELVRLNDLPPLP